MGDGRLFPAWTAGVQSHRGEVHPRRRWARTNRTIGIAFVTNQELRLSEREALMKAAGDLKAELYHLERVTAILDQPSMGPVRQQFLGLGDATPSALAVVD